MVVPNGSMDTATFAQNFTRSVFISANIEVNGITFPSVMFPSAYTIPADPGVALNITGAGITNSSGLTQNFVTGVSASNSGAVYFRNSATAGTSTIFTNNGGTGPHVGGSTVFLDSATAGNGTFINNGGMAYGIDGGGTSFLSNATAANGTFTSNGATVSGAYGGALRFFDNSRAGSATLIANGGTNGGGGGSIVFGDPKSSGDTSTGDTARVEVFGNGSLDISGHDLPGLTLGSIEGNGFVFLRANNLTVGSNNLSTTFSGTIQDGGYGGSLSKIGKGKLTLNFPSTYTGGTTINKGTLVVKNTIDSATGTGAMQVNLGTLEGVGKIEGAVTVGTGVGTTSRANLLGGNSNTSPGTLTINNSVTFQSDSTYKCVLNRSSRVASKVTALGVTINNAQFAFTQVGTGTLAVGTVFRVIDNITSNLAISGRFRNLSNGLVLTSNDGTKFKVNYTGGTGNDLTLKVVP